MIYLRPLVLITLLYIQNFGSRGDHTCWIEILKNAEQGAISDTQMTDCCISLLVYIICIQPLYQIGGNHIQVLISIHSNTLFIESHL